MGNTYISSVAASLPDSSLGHSSLGHSFGATFGFSPQSTGNAKRLCLNAICASRLSRQMTPGGGAPSVCLPE